MTAILQDDTETLNGVERVFGFLRDKLLSGELKPGDRLLSERELALALNISRPALREALRALAMLGLLDIRQNRGAFVSRADLSLLGDFLTVYLAQQPDMLDDIVQARIAIECQAIRLACERATDADLTRIGACLSALVTTLQDPERGGEADFRFHLELVKASHSASLLMLYRGIGDLLLRSHVERRRITVDAPGVTDYLVEAHREVFLAVVDRDPDQAERSLREHFAIGDEIRRQSWIATYRTATDSKKTRSTQGEKTS